MTSILSLLNKLLDIFRVIANNRKKREIESERKALQDDPDKYISDNFGVRVIDSSASPTDDPTKADPASPEKLND